MTCAPAETYLYTCLVDFFTNNPEYIKTQAGGIWGLGGWLGSHAQLWAWGSGKGWGYWGLTYSTRQQGTLGEGGIQLTDPLTSSLHL